VIDAVALLADCQAMVRTLVDDLRKRCNDVAEVDDVARRQWLRAQAAHRTAQPYESWREGWLTQVAAAWVLGCVFVRFCEDNGLVHDPLLSGPGERRGFAQDNRQLHLREHPTEGDRDWLLSVFDRYSVLPGLGALLGPHNPLWQAGPSADGARALVEMWWRIDPGTGQLIHDFTDDELNTRFLGDLYQHLSPDARDTFALYQTPAAVEKFLLDRTLNPAVEEFGLVTTTLIDPTCGSGHLCIGAFGRLFSWWIQAEPHTNRRVLAQRALNAVYGVDLNPFAAAIARFRLLVAGLQATGEHRLTSAPNFRINVAVGDSLLFGTRSGRWLLDDTGRHSYETEDSEQAQSILSERYSVVVGNPPYPVPRDAALREAYRRHYATCHGQYSLAVPFTERFMDLAMPGAFVGMITANSFMKREFGKKLINHFLASVDLTHVVDSSGAPLAGHGTGSVILFLRQRAPVSSAVRAVLKIRDEPRHPNDPEKGIVWTSIVNHIDSPGFENEYISVCDLPRDRLRRHPWSIGGGGMSELKERLDSVAVARLRDIVDSIGPVAYTRQDDAYFAPLRRWRHLGVPAEHTIPIGTGEDVRDWVARPSLEALFPYNSRLEAKLEQRSNTVLWPSRRILQERSELSGRQEEIGLTWFEWNRFLRHRFRVSLGLCFAEIATHFHVAFDRGGSIFNQTAPTIKLKSSDEAEYLRVLGHLASSTGCFWLKQVMYPKGGDGVGRGIQDERWETRYAFDGTKLRGFPLSKHDPSTLVDLVVSEAVSYRQALDDLLTPGSTPTRERLETAKAASRHALGRMIALQEELDWFNYVAYGLLDEDTAADLDELPELTFGERAFEIGLARRIKQGDFQTSWFDRHRSAPVLDVPEDWPDSYRHTVERRISVIESNEAVALIERPEFKRRWATERWEDFEREILGDWLVDRLGSPHYWPEPRLASASRLADAARLDDDFMAVAELIAPSGETDLTTLVAELLAEEAVPYLAAYRYKDSGLRKWSEWQHVWELQRAEDAIVARAKLAESQPGYVAPEVVASRKLDEVGDVPIPPKYRSSDFRRTSFWKLRGKLDVPKERFISYPGAERENDPSPVFGWAGWDHVERARALAGWYTDQRDAGIGADRLTPYLAGLWELIPWLRQWHNEPDPTYGERMGDFFASFVTEQAGRLGKTTDDLVAWRPPASAGRKRRQAAG
jgi:hypothetical protein